MIILYVYKDLILNSVFCNLTHLDHILRRTVTCFIDVCLLFLANVAAVTKVCNASV